MEAVDKKKERHSRYYLANKGKWKVYDERHRATPGYRERKNREQEQARQRIYARLNAIKLASGCVDCGYNVHPHALHFDHVHGQKVAAVGDMVKNRISWDKIDDEIAKCEVRCANCHAIKTTERGRRAGEPQEAETEEPTLRLFAV